MLPNDSPIPPLKQCCRCGLTKPIDQFGNRQRSADKHDGYCRLCRNYISRESLKKIDPERKRAWGRNRYYRNKEKINQAHREKYALKHPKPPIPEWEPASKQCTKCLQVKPLDQFVFTPKGKYQRCARCNTCNCAASLAYHRAHPEWARAQYKKWSQKKGAQHFAQITRAWAKKNPDKIKESRAKDYSLHKETHAARMKRYGTSEKGRLTSRLNAQRRRQRLGKTHLTVDEVKLQLQIQKGRCHWCGVVMEKYHIDHVIPISKGGPNEMGNIVLACQRCNSSKGKKSLKEWAKQMKLF